jgi:hypothetical protein
MVAGSGQLRAAYALLQAGASLQCRTRADCLEADLPCNAGASPLHVAALRGDLSMCLLLVSCWVRGSQAGEQGAADPRAVTDAYGNTPASAATSRGSGGKPDEVLHKVGAGQLGGQQGAGGGGWGQLGTALAWPGHSCTRLGDEMGWVPPAGEPLLHFCCWKLCGWPPGPRC